VAGSRSYKTGEAFRTALEERLAQIARQESIDLQRVRRQVAFDRLLARLAKVRGQPWVLKGGYAMELRYRHARSTKDLDFTMRFAPRGPVGTDPILESVREAAAADIDDFFTYRIAKARSGLGGAPYGGARYPVECLLGGRTFSRFHLDIGIGDLVIEPAVMVRCRDWLSFAGIHPAAALTISPEQQFAEKLHAYTFPRIEADNSRVRDLVDMYLLVDSRLSKEPTKAAIASTFGRRGTHPIPATLQRPPEEWGRPFSALASECSIDIDVGAAFETIKNFFQDVQV
jgi:hypothetical protein